MVTQLSWISKNARLENGISIINRCQNAHFESLLKRISDSNTGELLTDNEKVKFKELLKINDNELELFMQSLLHIFKQSHKVILKPTELQKQLKECLKLDEEKSEIFTKMWTENVRQNFNLEETWDLKDVAWELNVQAGSSISNKEIIPNARMQLNLNLDDKTEDVLLELSEEELLHLYNTLENIQTKLDAIK